MFLINKDQGKNIFKYQNYLKETNPFLLKIYTIIANIFFLTDNYKKYSFSLLYKIIRDQ